ncbi:YraN family protein [Candidatus Omnitrophota bacterium]
MGSSAFGDYGEELAVFYLKEQGYKIIETNYVNKIGEIDIIARDGDVLCFIEVKARQGLYLGHPLEAVSIFKQKKLRRVAQWYIAQKQIRDMDLRFDVVGVLVEDQHYPKIELIKDAF